MIYGILILITAIQELLRKMRGDLIERMVEERAADV